MLLLVVVVHGASSRGDECGDEGMWGCAGALWTVIALSLLVHPVRTFFPALPPPAVARAAAASFSPIPPANVPHVEQQLCRCLELGPRQERTRWSQLYSQLFLTPQPDICGPDHHLMSYHFLSLSQPTSSQSLLSCNHDHARQSNGQPLQLVAGHLAQFHLVSKPLSFALFLSAFRNKTK